MRRKRATKQHPFMPLFFGDFLAATSEWEGMERSLYLTLLAYQWAQGSLPTDHRKLARLVDWDRELFDASWRQVGHKFHEDGGRLYNARLEQHRAKAKEISAKNTAAGRKGAAAKWRRNGERHGGAMANAKLGNGGRHRGGMANANSKDGERQSSAIVSPMARGYGNPNHTNPTHTTPKHSIESKDAKPPAAADARAPEAISATTRREGFEQVQAVYPAGIYRANAWLQAERNFSRLIDEQQATAAELIAAATAYRDQKQASRSIATQYVLSPAKFFDPREGHWRGPFPIPKDRAEMRVEENIVAGAREFLEGGAS